MAYDASAAIAGATTATATATNSAAFDLKTTPGTPRTGLAIRVRGLSDSAATAGATYYFQAQQSPDTTTWYNLFQSPSYTPGTATASRSVVDLPFSATERYIRLQTVISAVTGTPAVVFSGADLGADWPG